MDDALSNTQRADGGEPGRGRSDPGGGAVRDAAAAWWRERLGGDWPVTELPTDRARPATARRRGRAHRFELDDRTVAGARTLATARSIPVTTVLLAGFVALVGRYVDQDDLLIGLDLSGEWGGARPDRPAALSLLRVGAACGSTFSDLLDRVNAALAGAAAHRALDLPQIVEAVTGRAPAGLPFHVACRPLENAASLDEPVDGSSCDLLLEAYAGSGTVAGRLIYDPDLFEPPTVERMAAHLGMLLAAAVADPATRLSALPLLTAEERGRIVHDWNESGVDFPSERCLHELFEQSVARDPDATAVVFEGRSMSYGELDRLANRLAHRLRGMGVGPDVMVGICVERSFDMVTGLLGIAKAGGAYVPIDASYPRQRIEFMLQDTDVPVLLTQRPLLSVLPEHGASVVLLDEEALDDQPETRLDAGARPENLSYVIYTSGSTGRPKGVMLDHRGRVNNFTDFNRRYAIGPGDRLLALSSLSFDMSAYDVFGTLAAGATIVVPPPETKLDPFGWGRLMVRHAITVWHSVPALLEMMVDQVESRQELHPRSLRLVLLGGDWIPLTLPPRIAALGSDEIQVVSMGGATECSMDSTIYDVEAVEPSWKSIPYGFPMANQRSYVLDRNLNPMPVGVPGELHLGGIGVARGYLNRPELTAEKFIPNPFIDGERIYKTGDLARYRPDGNLELLGRIDFQVKIRGFRVELGEIESAIRQHPRVKECVLLAKSDKYGDKRLVAYVVTDPADSSSAPLGPELRRHLDGLLPSYMVPAAFVALEAFPLNPNGKINRRALPEPSSFRPELEQPFIAPRDGLETVVAGLWSETLGLDDVGVHDGFIELGGSSLLAGQIAAQARELFGLELQIADVHRFNVEQLARHLADAGRHRGIDVQEIANTLIEITGRPETGAGGGTSGEDGRRA